MELGLRLNSNWTQRGQWETELFPFTALVLSDVIGNYVTIMQNGQAVNSTLTVVQQKCSVTSSWAYVCAISQCPRQVTRHYLDVRSESVSV